VCTLRSERKIYLESNISLGKQALIEKNPTSLYYSKPKILALVFLGPAESQNEQAYYYY